MNRRARVAATGALAIVIGLLAAGASASGPVEPSVYQHPSAWQSGESGRAQVPTAAAARQPTPTAAATAPRAQAPTSGGAVRDCGSGSNLSCLIEASLSCQPTMMSYTSTVDMTVMISRLEIRQGDAETCTLYDFVVDVRVQYDEPRRRELRGAGATEAEIQQQEDQATRLARALTVERDALCPLPRAELTALLPRWNQGSFTGRDLNAEICSGTLFGPQSGPAPTTPSAPTTRPRPSGPPPSNDDFASAEVLSVPGFTTGDSSTATAEPGETRSCGMEEPTVWFAVTPEGAGTLTATTAGSLFDTVLAIYIASSLADLVLVDCNDDAPDLKTSEVRIPVTEGTTYYIQLGGWSPSEPGGLYNLEVRLDS